MKKALLISFAAMSLMVCNGCALLLVGGAAAAGAGAVYYMDGQLKDTEAVSLPTANAATLAALHDLKFVVISNAQDALTDKIIARTATDTKIEITLTKQSAKITEIRIRVGTFGNEQMSRDILNQIKSHL